VQCRSIDPTKFGVSPRYIGTISNNLVEVDKTVRDIQCNETESAPDNSSCTGCVACSNLSLNYRLNSNRILGDRLTCLQPRDGGFVRKVKCSSLETMYGAPYFRASKLISFMSSSMCPKDIVFNLLLGVKWLLRDAVVQSGKSEFLGADLMFPILVLILVHANLPTMHLILYFLKSFSAVDNYGEAAYYVTCLEAAVLFIDRFEVPQESKQLVDDCDDPFAGLPLASPSKEVAVGTVDDESDEKQSKDIDESGSFSYTDLHSDEECSRDDVEHDLSNEEIEVEQDDNPSRKDEEKVSKNK